MITVPNEQPQVEIDTLFNFKERLTIQYMSKITGKLHANDRNRIKA